MATKRLYSTPRQLPVGIIIADAHPTDATREHHETQARALAHLAYAYGWDLPREILAQFSDGKSQKWDEVLDDIQQWLYDEDAIPPFTGFYQSDPYGLYGIYVDMSAAEDSDEVLRIEAGTLPETFREFQRAVADIPPRDIHDINYILEVNDHGNCTLYDTAYNEIWSVV